MNPLIKQQDEKAGNLAPTPCLNCKKMDCKRLCLVNCVNCHEQHKFCDLDNRVCPDMSRLSKKLIFNRSLECPKCKGRGNYRKVKEVVFSQLNENYQKRLDIWRSKKNYDLQDEQNEEWLKPVLKVSRRVVHEKVFNCRLCTNGRIFRMRNCCPSGCPRCKYQGVVLSRRWQMCRSKFKETYYSIPMNEELKTIGCHICSLKFVVGQSVYQMECLHGFHTNCIRKNFEKKLFNCPLCQISEPVYFRQELCKVRDEEEIKLEEGEEIDLSENDFSFSSFDPEDAETQIRESSGNEYFEQDF